MSAGDAGGGFNFLVTLQMFGKDERPQPAHGVRVSHVDRVEVDPRAPGDTEMIRAGAGGGLLPLTWVESRTAASLSPHALRAPDGYS